MARKAEAPKGEAFLPGTNAAELREMAKRAGGCIGPIRCMAMYEEKRHEIKRSLTLLDPGTRRSGGGSRGPTVGIAAVPRRRGGSRCQLAPERRAEPFADAVLTPRGSTATKPMRGTVGRPAGASKKPAARRTPERRVQLFRRIGLRAPRHNARSAKSRKFTAA